ncbi:MAG: adenylate/guanylate cyclase domain-containing protein [Nitrospirae bacterium]|nr:adenylate/guanylate cyclase domain-containing protein [Nitrospirota bacterium]
MTGNSASPLETRITGSLVTRFWLELFGNSAHFPIANIMLELLSEKPLDYLGAPDLYTIVSASLVQAYLLARWRIGPTPRRFWGNLVGPALYTLVESLVEGPRFFLATHHLAYWGFAVAVGAMQAQRLRLPPGFSAPLIVIENITRTSILFFMYVVFETLVNPAQTASLSDFIGDTSHQFIGLAVLFLGLSVGLANLTTERYLALLKMTSTQLRTYSEWLLGRDLLGQTFVNPSALSLTRRERTVMFMDIRSFTRWSEAQSPEAVVDLLDRYYQVAESVISGHGVIKFKLSADEVMAVFPTAEQSVRAALELRAEASRLLSGYNLGVGIGLNSGPLVEGLLGSAEVKFYDVIGDTVNTAKRMESAAQTAEVLISESIRNAVGQTFRTGPRREIVAKGKENPLAVYPLEN